MRILLSKNSREKLFNFLIKEYKCKSLKELSIELNLPYKTIQNWRYYQERYIPDKIIPKEIKNKLEVLDKQEDNWGKVKGGKKTYKIIINKYGKEEIKKRQINGGKVNTIKIKNQPNLIELDLNNPLFLELYGVLLGDGWMSKLTYRGKSIYLIGISGNAKLDRDFILYIKKNVKLMFNRNAYLKERPKYNAIELQILHKFLLEKLNKELEFPIGRKINLEINKKIYDLGYEKMRYVIRGIFDTDGCVYFDKTPIGNPYPCISITMKAPILMDQVRNMLVEKGFKVLYDDYNYPIIRLKLKGSKQLKKWINEIGSSNLRNLNNFARVAQSG
ncbi:hypothetical protein COX97_00705 [Candidatus Pacearchaeota archaeon CG_4_10_14_0_2_um_filter_05_32_18]|nr:MAG: hypothetical protein COX97_00705 [Candidatus Pacearchaeota archaeon CG_4_10_14_0_2_um_filter_05_32_18]